MRMSRHQMQATIEQMCRRLKRIEAVLSEELHDHVLHKYTALWKAEDELYTSERGWDDAVAEFEDYIELETDCHYAFKYGGLKDETTD